MHLSGVHSISLKHICILACVVFLSIDNVILKVRKFNNEQNKEWRASRKLSQGVWEIPRHIFFFTDGSDEVDLLSKDSGWAPRIYNETTARIYIDANCSSVTPAYDRVAPIAAKADIFRLCALFMEGGLYLDDDLFPLLPLDLFALADKYGLLLVEDAAPTGYWGNRISDDISVWQAFIGSAWIGHPFFACGLDTILANVMQHNVEKDLLFITGPHALRKCTRDYHFRFQTGNGESRRVVSNKSHVVVIHKVFPSRRGRGRHYSTFSRNEIVTK